LSQLRDASGLLPSQCQSTFAGAAAAAADHDDEQAGGVGARLAAAATEADSSAIKDTKRESISVMTSFSLSIKRPSS
jgi:hypothetical protein